MKMFRPLIGLSLAILFLFTCVPTVSAASDSKKKDKKEESSGKKKSKKKDKKEDAGDDKKSKEKADSGIDKNNPYYYKLKKLEELKEDLAATSSANKKKKLNVRIKKIQADIKSDHDRAVARLKKRIHNLELRLKGEHHKTFRENYEKQIEAAKALIDKLDAWAGIEKKDAKDTKAPAAAKGAAPAKGGGKAPAAKGGKDDAPASADELGLDL